jgi:tetratricopeptide (TPR) repeat protein
VNSLILAIFLLFSASPQQPAKTPGSALVVVSEPQAIVWIDEIRRGTTDAGGKLSLAKILPGRHTVRVRANGFREASTPLLPGRKTLTVKLVPTTDRAELLYQEAENTREAARDDASREKAAELYREAIKLRPIPGAYVGLARLLLDLNRFRDAHAAIDSARRLRPSFAEASAVEGRIYREEAFDQEAIRSFRRSIKEGGGVQPEARVGLARVLEDKALYNDAVVELRAAINQLSDSEPVIYQMLGAAYEKAEKPKEAVVAYEKYLQLAPNGSYATAIRSILGQLKRDAAGEEIIP